jgi:hypothetical protein
MDGRGTLARSGVRIVSAAKWLVYCGAVAVVGGGVVFVLTAAWLGIPVARAIRETPLFGAVSPSLAAVGVLLATFVIVLDTDLRS